ncbi:hypothetical protein MRX96_046291 [Rhipicephalus microplus]
MVRILKSQKAVTELSTDRSVVLTLVAGKVMEALELRRLRWIATAINAFPPEQSGFCPRGCTFGSLADAIVTLVEAKYRGDFCIFVLLDLNDRLLVYVDESDLRDRSVAAACVVPSLRTILKGQNSPV